MELMYNRPNFRVPQIAEIREVWGDMNQCKRDYNHA
jgi:hypothetical protein